MNMVDVVVIGAGINGSWTALHLAKQGHKTILIDQFPLPHSRGSSHGQSRGIRKAYAEPYLTEMMGDAYDQWHRLEQENDVRLIKDTGLLVFGQHRQDPYLDNVVQSLSHHKLDFKLFSPEDMSKVYPNLNMGPEAWGCLDPAGGVILADKALNAVWKSVEKYGGQIIDNVPVAKISVDNGSAVQILLRTGRVLSCKKVVICAGPWTNKLLEPLGWKLPLKPIRIPVFYFKSNGHIPHTFSIEETDVLVWGLPELEYEGLVKICLHSGPHIDPDYRDVVDSNADKERLRKFISEKFPCVAPSPSIEESCIYTVSPDGVHILDRHPNHPNIVVGCGFSGSGFKLGPVTGEFLANMAMEVPTKYDDKYFLASRFSDEALTAFCSE